MDSYLSPILENLFMETFEQKVLSSATHSPSCFFRYPDDGTFTIYHHGSENYKNYLNSLIKKIKFTMETWEERKLYIKDPLSKRLYIGPRVSVK